MKLQSRIASSPTGSLQPPVSHPQQSSSATAHAVVAVPPVSPKLPSRCGGGWTEATCTTSSPGISCCKEQVHGGSSPTARCLSFLVTRKNRSTGEAPRPRAACVLCAGPSSVSATEGPQSLSAPPSPRRHRLASWPALRIEKPSDEKVVLKPPEWARLGGCSPPRCDPFPVGVRGISGSPKRGVGGQEPPTESSDPSRLVLGCRFSRTVTFPAGPELEAVCDSAQAKRGVEGMRLVAKMAFPPHPPGA